MHAGLMSSTDKFLEYRGQFFKSFISIRVPDEAEYALVPNM